MHFKTKQRQKQANKTFLIFHSTSLVVLILRLFYKMSDTVHSIIKPLCVFDHLVSDHHIFVIKTGSERS